MKFSWKVSKQQVQFAYLFDGKVGQHVECAIASRILARGAGRAALRRAWLYGVHGSTAYYVCTAGGSCKAHTT